MPGYAEHPYGSGEGGSGAEIVPVPNRDTTKRTLCAVALKTSISLCIGCASWGTMGSPASNALGTLQPLRTGAGPLCARQTGDVEWVKVPYDEGVANHIIPRVMRL
jgi:hypothetical protein